MNRGTIMEEYYDPNCQVSKELDYSLEMRQSVRFDGYSGTGKTAMVRQWMNHHKEDIHGIFLDGAVQPKCSGEIRFRGDLVLKGQFFTSDFIDELLASKNIVVAVDNYQKLNEYQKYHFLLLCDGYVVDEREEGYYRQIPGMAFVCAIKTIELETNGEKL